ncbi:halocyanin domain-containing protein [Haloprofundus halophilus]|uniref:halocyanin domain-containing protein n=1 Tax=Haloprofundus halophilus TaxID=2283527 RepID=UPI000E451A66|nr:halocyanin domain-containing protein [Haloprofundus halophilus]
MVPNTPLDSDAATTRRRVLALAAATGGASLAGCLDETPSTAGDSDEASDSGESDDSGESSSTTGDAADPEATVEEWMSDGLGYDGVVDETGTGRVTVRVGADSASGPYAYDPAAVRVSPGTVVVWKWTGAGGRHNVVERDGEFESRLYSSGDATFEYTADAPGTYLYFCTPHRGMGMKGAVVVDDS